MGYGLGSGMGSARVHGTRYAYAVYVGVGVVRYFVFYKAPLGPRQGRAVCWAKPRPPQAIAHLADCKGQTTVANWHATLARRKANRM
jgi:hypothetical protein